MASKSDSESEEPAPHQHAASGHLLESSSLKPKLDAMLKDLVTKLPSVDDEDSDYEEGSDEYEIFQRPIAYGNLLDDEDKDLDESLPEEELQMQFSNIRETQVGIGDGVLVPDPGTLNPTNNSTSRWTQSQFDFRDAERTVLTQTAEMDQLNVEPASRLSIDLNQRSMHPSRLAWSDSAADGDVPVPTIPQARSSRRDNHDAARNWPGLKLSLGHLENFDLDLALQSVIENEYRNSPRSRSRSSSIDLFELQPGDNLLVSKEMRLQSTDLMNKLVKYSTQQSGESLDIDPITGRPRGRSSRKSGVSNSNEEKDDDTEKPPPILLSTGISTNNNATPLKELSARPKSQRFTSAVPSAEPNTVFLDLRKPEDEGEREKINEAILRVLKMGDKSGSDPSDSSEDDDGSGQHDWFAQRRQVKDALARGETPKAPMESNRLKPFKHNPPQRVHKIKERAQSTAVNQNKSVKPSELYELKDEELLVSAAMPASAPTSEASELKTENETPHRLEQLEKEIKLKQAAESMLKCKQSVGKLLEKHQPKESSNKTQKAAPSTPMHFHFDTSFEKIMSPTLGTGDLDGATLLTVFMTSNGEIAPYRPSHSKTGSIEQDGSWSVSYIALLTWICSLVHHCVSNIPFYVTAMQQCFYSGQFMLLVAVKSNPGYSEARGGKRKPKGDQTDQFRARMDKFLTSHTLTDVNPWLAQCESQLIGCMSKERPATFKYQPPLPTVSKETLSIFMKVDSDLDLAKKYFSAPTSFYWRTLDVAANSSYQDRIQGTDTSDIQNSLVLVNKLVYSEPQSLFSILSRILQNGLDISGIRLATPEVSTSSFEEGTSTTVGLILAIAIRGTLARPIWLEELGPMDPQLARQSAPSSLNALCGGLSRETGTLFTPRNPTQVAQEINRWFGGRLNDLNLKSPDTIPDVKCQNVKAPNDKSSAVSPAALLTASITSEVILLVSPLLPANCIGVILASCQRRGYQVCGIRRRRINQKQASLLGVQTRMCQYFVASENLSSPRMSTDTLLGAPSSTTGSHPQPIFLIQLSKENALHHASSLTESLMVQLTLVGLLDCVATKVDGTLTSSHLFQIIGYSEPLLTALGGELTKVPEVNSPAHTGYIAPKLHSNPELEQISVLSLLGHHHTTTFSLLLGRLLNTMPHSHSSHPRQPCDPKGLELLGLKWLPSISSFIAKELFSHEVAKPHWKATAKEISSRPAIFLVFRGINCANRIRDVVDISPAGRRQAETSFDHIVSDRADSTFRLLSLLFFDRELFADDSKRNLLMYLPPVRSEIKSHTDVWLDEGISHKPNNKRPRSGRSSRTPPKTPPKTPPHASKIIEESILKSMQLGPRPIASLLIIKPSVIQKNNLSRLLRSLIQAKFKIVGLKLAQLTEFDAMCLQCQQLQQNSELYQQHCRELTSGDSLILALFRENGVKYLLDLIGPEDPVEAKRLDEFTWRAQHGKTLAQNGFYVSTSYPRAVSDIKRYFPNGICCQETLDLQADRITAPAVDRELSLAGRFVENNTSVDLSGSLGSRYLSRLLEVNCVVFMPDLLKTETSENPALFIDVIQCLQAAGVLIVAAKMVWLTEEQAQSYLHMTESGSFRQAPALTCLPILVLAIQLENAILSFNYTIELGMAKVNKDKNLYLPHLLSAKEKNMANKLLSFFFIQLSAGCTLTITDADRK